tara:strand:- start:17939 stop:19813 length:1875 start_codon:yes stop_codon:yes gene_type:complete
MTWEVGKYDPIKQGDPINDQLLKLKGHLDEQDAKYNLHNFLRENITFTTNLLSGVELFPFQHLAIKSMLETDYFLGIWSRGMSKSFSTAIYAFLDAIFNQGVQIGILAATFRQSKMIFEKIEDIASKPEAQFLSQCITKKSKKNDQWTLEIGESKIIALPLGDGSKLRGFRFHRIIIDEFLLMPEHIYNEVILPFLSVVQNPTEREKVRKLEDQLIAQGKMEEKDRYVWPNNKLIALSSASYKFEYLYKVYETFEDLIVNGVPPGSEDTSRRVIMHLSYDVAPKALYDQNLINQSKQTMSQSQFDREFNAIFTDDSSGYFKTSTMAACTISEGDAPHMEIAGERDSKYLLAFDPSWAESESSDDFAIQVFKLNDNTKTGTLVHSYAVPGLKMQDHINYFHYILSNFNIVCIIGDYGGGVQFLQAANASEKFNQSKIKIEEIGVEFDDLENYQKVLIDAKNAYNLKERKICVLRKPSSDWIRRANELLQANFDHKKIWFGSRPLDENYHKQVKKDIPINNLIFMPNQKELLKGSGSSKIIDFIDHQHDMVNYTKNQCALIQVSASPQGTQTFGLPPSLRRQSGPNKTRKDSYSAFVLGNWMIKTYYDFMDAESSPTESTFIPYMV